MKYLVFLFLSIIGLTAFAQVKVGNNPSEIDINSLLELESSNKVFVLNKMNNSEMNAIKPLQGALVYNSDENCLFIFQGTIWKSLCDSYNVAVTTSTTAPLGNNSGDIWIDNSNPKELISIWNGSKWVPINSNPNRGKGLPTAQTNLNPLAGDIYVDETSGDIFSFNGTSWLNNSEHSKYTAANGIVKTDENSFELGGALTKETTLETNATNTLAIKGLEKTIDANANEIVVVNKNTGVLQKMQASNLLREEEIVVIAEEGQSQFSPPYPIANPKQIDVYRNGVRINFTVVNNTTIELEPEAICYKNDKVRIVQFY
ncbi:hypothetical protein [Lutibacter citreus]|uniref:hypothetical protein n=1 Tax=Lutibacter citreus TaxID=2138210 RepID=UPI0013002FE4|nr:hypothetical protein [Lutibacter citreus]